MLALSVNLVSAQAEPAHGIAMQGSPKYAAGFAHFDYVNPDAPKGGTLRLSVTTAFDSLNPHTVRGLAAPGLAQTFETLMARPADEPFSLYGLIAESVDVAEDRSAIEFVLRPEAAWHDGSPITAADVLFSWQAHRDHGLANRRLFYAKVDTAVQTGPRSLRFTFKRNPDGSIDREMPLIMGLMPILSATWWQGRDLARPFLDEAPMGSGPYRVASFEPGRRIVYQRVADYWGRNLPARRGLYNADRLDFTVYRDDRIALEAFLSGDVDLRREIEPGAWVDSYRGPAVEDGRIMLEELPNQRPQAARGFVFNTRRAPFDDIRVRKALALMLDDDWIGHAYFHNLLRPTRSYFPNSELAAPPTPPQGLERQLLQRFNDRLRPEVLDTPPALAPANDPPDRRAAQREALRLLAEAGWAIRDERLTNSQGQPFTFEILINDPKEQRVTLEFVRALQRLGATPTLRLVDSAQFQARLKDFDFDITVGGWESSLSPGNEQLYYYGSGAADDAGSRNLPGVTDPVVDELARGLARAETREDLVAHARALDRVLLSGWYFAPLLHSPVDRIAHWRHLRRPDVTPLYGPPLEAWWIAPSPFSGFCAVRR